MKTLLSLILIVAVCVGGFYLFQRHQTNSAMSDGSVTCVGCLTPEQAAAYNKFDHGEGPEPEFDRRRHNDSPTEISDQTQPATSQADSPTGQAAQRSVQPSAPSGQLNSPVAARGTDTTPITSPAPTEDTAIPQARNGVRFTGSGVYQWYREGDLTWRLNTQTGASCIIYATMEEWRKRVVLDHGCGSSL